MLINEKVFNPGSMNKQVILAARSIATDAGGFQSKTYPLIAQVWARWTNVHGQEVWAAEARGAEEAATLIIRYRGDIDNTCVIVKDGTLGVGGTTYTGGVVFEIVSMDNIQEKDEYIELKIKRMKAG